MAAERAARPAVVPRRLTIEMHAHGQPHACGWNSLFSCCPLQTLGLPICRLIDQTSTKRCHRQLTVATKPKTLPTGA